MAQKVMKLGCCYDRRGYYKSAMRANRVLKKLRFELLVYGCDCENEFVYNESKNGSEWVQFIVSVFFIHICRNSTERAYRMFKRHTEFGSRKIRDIELELVDKIRSFMPHLSDMTQWQFNIFDS